MVSVALGSICEWTCNYSHKYNALCYNPSKYGCPFWTCPSWNPKRGQLTVLQQKHNQIKNIHTWISAFINFMSIMLEKWPDALCYSPSKYGSPLWTCPSWNPCTRFCPTPLRKGCLKVKLSVVFSGVHTKEKGHSLRFLYF
jgi:hypothetical protein